MQKRLLKSFIHAFQGLAVALREERNLRIHFLAMMVVIILGFYFQIGAWEWCILVLASVFVISLELVNTAIENWTDLVSPQQNFLAGKIKDISAAAVLIASLGSIAVGVVIFAKYLF